MKSIFVIFTLALLLTNGCSKKNDGNWKYTDGYVVAKEDSRVLVVREEVANINAPLDEILKDATPNAIWLTVSTMDYDAVKTGDHVNISFPDGSIIEDSYPAQATADIEH